MFNSSKRVSIVCRGWNCSHAPACILSLSRMPHIVTVIFPIIVSPLRWFVLSCISADDDQTIQTYGIAHLKLRECQGTSVFTSLTVRQKFDCATCMTMYLHDRYVMIHSTMNYNDLYNACQNLLEQILEKYLCMHMAEISVSFPDVNNARDWMHCIPAFLIDMTAIILLELRTRLS